MKTDQKEIRFLWVLAVILAVGCFSFFQYAYSAHLFLKEQLQLYLFTSDYFLSYLAKPAALACNIGDFLTQFFYLRGGGAVVLTILLLVEWYLVVQVLRRWQFGVLAALFALFPILAEWVLHTDLLYAVASTVSIILLILVYLLYSRIRGTWQSTLAGGVLMCVSYILFGSVSLLFPLLVIVQDLIDGKGRWLYGIVLILLSLSIPMMLRDTYLLTIKQVYLYPFGAVGQLAGAGLLVLVMFVALCDKIRVAPMNVMAFTVLSACLLLLLGVGIGWKANFKRERLFELATATYFGNWEKVYEHLCQSPVDNNRLATYYTNMALSRRGELPERLMDFYQPAAHGLFLSVGPEAGWLPIFFSSDVFYYLGDMNLAQHSAMLGMTFSPKHRSSRMVKRLAEINMANEDTTAARKYLRLLDATLFHSGWAAKQEALMSQTDSVSSWIQDKRAQLPAFDKLRTASDYAASLTILVESNPDNRAALDYLLCYHLLTKNIPAFAKAYDTWYKRQATAIPRVYSEALLVYLAGTKASEKVIQSYKIPSDKIAAFLEYTRIYEAHNGEMEPLRETYDKTYWYYFHFAQLKSGGGIINSE